MRLFNRKASLSSSKSQATADNGAKGKRTKVRLDARARSAQAMFERLEGRQMFSASAAIATEYLATAHETDAYGTCVQTLLGNATSGVVSVPGVSGASMQTYHDNGVILYSPTTGAHVVLGSIGAEYTQLARETDAYGRDVQLLLGLPTSDEMNVSGVSGGRANTFQNGSIDWSASTGAHVIFGAIGGLYNNIGGATSWLGLPTSDEAGPQNDRVVDFQGGSISWSPSGGAVSHETDVKISTRYGDELVVTETGTHDTVSVSQSGLTLSILADGTTFSEPVTAAGLFVYARANDDTITINPSVSTQTTVDTVGNISGSVIGNYGKRDIIWCNTNDAVYDSLLSFNVINRVGSFAGGVSKAPGWTLVCPSDAGTEYTANASLFGAGPVAADVNQREAGDCGLMATLAAFATSNPGDIRDSAVDLGDGTYAVEFYKNGTTPEFVRVNNKLTDDFAQPGPDGDIWAPIMEKAMAYFRTGANTYASLSSGWMSEYYSDLGVTSTSENPNTFSDSQLFARLSTDLADGVPVTLANVSASVPNLVANHAYTLVGLKVVNGQNLYIVRNPWGFSGDKLENSQGIAVITYSELINNLTTLTEAG